MSPASKSKSKDKSTPRAGKEQPKVSIKPSPVHSNVGNGSSASAYNPSLGTFHTLEMSSSLSFLTPPSNGPFKTMDDPEDHYGNSPGTTGEYDSFSNNGSCSGESEDQKEKLNGSAPRVESIPGCDDKRDKIRQKNERKHQRQKEKRAQDLHERSNAFLTSRKLEALSHQLVTMGFPADRAMMAIIVNEGRMEESVAWLLHEGGEDDKQCISVKLEDKANLKVDITGELARITIMEAKYQCTRQDVERAVVAFEGDLMKVEGSLRLQKRAVSVPALPKSEERGDSAGLNDKIEACNQNTALVRSPLKDAFSATFQQQRRDEMDLNYKTAVPGSIPQEIANRNIQQPLKKNTWMTMSGAFSVSYPPLASPVQAAKSESQFVKEPFVVMRRPKQNLPSSTFDTGVSPPASTGWYPNGSPSIEILAGANGRLRNNLAAMGTNSSTPCHIYPRDNLHQLPPGSPGLTASSGWSNQSWSVSGTSPSSSSLTIPSSLGLFTGWGPTASSGSSSPNDWNTSGLAPHRDYTSIDWSLDLTPLRSSLKNDMVSETWSTMFTGGNASRTAFMNGGGGIRLPGLQERAGLLSDPLAAASSHEWTNPFEGRDLFRIPRQYVTSSPSLL